MKLKIIFYVVAIAVASLSAGCSFDAPTQGRPASKTELSQDIDKQLNVLEATPVSQRYIARQKLDKVVGAYGSKAQQARYAQLMSQVPMLPLGAPRGQLRSLQPAGRTGS